MSDSNKQKLDSVQAKALRKLISPVAQHVRGTSTAALQVDMGEPPLQAAAAAAAVRCQS